MRHALLALLAAAVVAPAPAAAAPREATLAQIALDAKAFKGEQVRVEASLGTVVAQKMLNQCKGKDKAFLVLPRIEGGTMAALSTVMVQLCVPADRALELAGEDVSTPIVITGQVAEKRKMGVLFALTFFDATVEVTGEAPNAVNVNVVNEP